MIWRGLFGGKPGAAQTLYNSLVQAARNERFYRDMGVPDTVDGRFDMIVVHVFLTLNALKGTGPQQDELKQSLTDAFFKDMDRSLREMGVGDLSVGKKVRKMAEAFYGRIDAYSKGIATGPEALRDALSRNIFADAPAGKPEELAGWMGLARASLEQSGPARIARGEIEWP